ncbi:MAG: hypothetical protein ACPGSE_00195 [Synechococcus sp.]
MTNEQLETLLAMDLPDAIPAPLVVQMIPQDDGSVDIEWDENDPVAQLFGCNTWTPTQWEAFFALVVEGNGWEVVDEPAPTESPAA